METKAFTFGYAKGTLLEHIDSDASSRAVLWIRKT